mmetsp:Transcript_5218/g.13931  ORF Transcript_5218/g.13931 Transcript_5218/m.13931 type:complete len:344 (+) Transcript_5218:654-1685(+)
MYGGLGAAGMVLDKRVDILVSPTVPPPLFLPVMTGSYLAVERRLLHHCLHDGAVLPLQSQAVEERLVDVLVLAASVQLLALVEPELMDLVLEDLEVPGVLRQRVVVHDVNDDILHRHVKLLNREEAGLVLLVSQVDLPRGDAGDPSQSPLQRLDTVAPDGRSLRRRLRVVDHALDDARVDAELLLLDPVDLHGRPRLTRAPCGLVHGVDYERGVELVVGRDRDLQDLSDPHLHHAPLAVVERPDIQERLLRRPEVGHVLVEIVLQAGLVDDANRVAAVDKPRRRDESPQCLTQLCARAVGDVEGQDDEAEDECAKDVYHEEDVAKAFDDHEHLADDAEDRHER